MTTENKQPLLVHVATVPETLWSFLDGQIGFMKRQGVAMAAISSPGELLDRFAARERIPVYGIPMTRRITPCRDLLALLKLWRMFRNMRPAIVHAHTPKGGLLGMTAAWLARVPIRVYHIRGLPVTTATGLKRMLLWCAEKLSCLFAHRVIAIGPSMVDEAIRLGICPAEKITILGAGGNGIDAIGRYNPRRFPASIRNVLRRKHGIPENALVIGYVGRIVRDKGMTELAVAWQSLREQFLDLHLLLIGAFEPQDSIPTNVEQLFCSDARIHMTGFVEDVAPYYVAMDVCVLPSYREGLPNAPLEAAAMQCPVVATRIPGCVDAVIDKHTGLLTPPRDSTALADALRAYLSDPELRLRHGAAGRRRVLSNFRPENIWDMLYREYADLLSNCGRLVTPQRPVLAATNDDKCTRAA